MSYINFSSFFPRSYVSLRLKQPPAHYPKRCDKWEDFENHIRVYQLRYWCHSAACDRHTHVHCISLYTESSRCTLHTDTVTFNFQVLLKCKVKCEVKSLKWSEKGKAVPLQAWSGPKRSRKLRFPDYMTTVQDSGKVISLTHRPPLPPGNAPGTHFC